MIEIKQNLENLMVEKIHRLALIVLGNYHDAWDLTQDVFCELEKGRQKWEQAQSKWAWTYGVFHHQLKKFLRYRSRRTSSSLDFDVPGTQESPEKKIIINEQLQKTFTAISNLNEEQAEALTLFSLEKLTIKEIAEIQKVATGTVKWRIFEARRQISQIMEEK